MIVRGPGGSLVFARFVGFRPLIDKERLCPSGDKLPGLVWGLSPRHRCQIDRPTMELKTVIKPLNGQRPSSAIFVFYKAIFIRRGARSVGFVVGMRGARFYAAAALVIVSIVVVAILSGAFSHREVHVRVSTTTSLYATGLLDHLAREFAVENPGVKIDFIAVGSGAALSIASRGDACALFVHAPSLESLYLSNATIYGHRIFAYNYFIIVGPPEDPANISKAQSAVEAFKRIYDAGEKGLAVFISRGDKSGTNVKELSLWAQAGLNPSGRPWYKNCGCGMDQALVQASEMRGYTLSDIGTYLAFKKQNRIPGLEKLYERGSELINIYSMYMSSACPEGPEKRYAQRFIDFVYQNQERLVGSFGVSQYGQPLFYPAKGVEDQLMRTWRELASKSS